MANKYPTRLDLFKKWAKAMEEGATVGAPKYPGTGKTRRGSPTRKTAHRRKRRFRRAKKAQD